MKKTDKKRIISYIFGNFCQLFSGILSWK